MAVEGARRRELAKLVSNHFLGDAHRDVLLTVVDAEGQSDELRQDRRTPAPHLDDFVPTGRTRGVRLLQHVAAGDDEFRGDLVLAGLLALGGEAPRGDRMTPARGAAFAAAMRMVDRVHGDAAVMRAAAEPALAPGLTD